LLYIAPRFIGHQTGSECLRLQRAPQTLNPYWLRRTKTPLFGDLSNGYDSLHCICFL